MVTCFFAGNYVFQVLQWPLKRAPFDIGAEAQVLRLMLGTNQLGVFHLGTNDLLTSFAGTNHYVRLDIVRVEIGTNTCLG